MRSGRREWRLALSDGMDVEAVIAGRKVLECYSEPNAGFGLRQNDGADLFALEVRYDRARRRRRIACRGSILKFFGRQPTGIAGEPRSCHRGSDQREGTGNP